MSRHRLARRVELEQLLGHVAHGLLDAGFCLFPRRAAEAVQRRARAPRVLLNEIEARDGDKELVLAVIAQLEELLNEIAMSDGDLLQARKLSDAVVDVNDEVAGFQVAKVRQERRGKRSLSSSGCSKAFFLEDIRFGVELKCRVG